MPGNRRDTFFHLGVYCDAAFMLHCTQIIQIGRIPHADEC
jgi:hypothetical protein